MLLEFSGIILFMTDAAPGAEHRRVIMDVSAEHLPGLMQVLGDFATTAGLNLQIGPSPEGTDAPSLSLEQPVQYNPALVTWMQRGDGDQNVPVITVGHLTHFAEDRYSARSTGARLAHLLTSPSKPEPEVIRPYQFTRGEQVMGLRADRFGELVGAIKDRSIRIDGIAGRLLAIMVRYDEELLIDSAVAADSES